MGLRGPKPGSRRGLKTGGRQKGTLNKSTAEVKSIAQKYGPAVIEMLNKIAFNEKEATEARIKAGKELLDRGYGKAPNAMHLAGHDGGPLDFGAMSTEQLEAMANRIVATLSQEEAKKK